MSYHCIVTDDPLMRRFGLSTFTIEQLESWLSDLDSGRNFKNLRYIKDIVWQRKDLYIPGKPDFKEDGTGTYQKEIKKAAQYFLGNTNTKYILDAWRKNYNASRYVKFSDFRKWSYFYNNNTINTKYIYSNLNFNEFDNKIVYIRSFTEQEKEDLKDIVDTTRLVIDQKFKVKLDNNISNIIEINNYVRMLIGLNYKDAWNETDKARIEFIRDIKTGRTKCLEWTTTIPFIYHTDPKSKEECIEEHTITFKLYLYDHDNPKRNGNSVAVQSSTMVSIPNSFGRPGRLENGGVASVEINNNDPANSVAGELTTQYNPNTGKFESGTQQIMAVIEEDIEPAVNASIDNIKELSHDTLVGNEQVKFGWAIPLHMWYGNPNALAPIYNATNDCRQPADNTKYRLRVVNVVDRAWKKGERCLLNKIDNFWIPSPLADAPEIEPQIGNVIGNWQFTYAATNSDFFHRRAEFTNVNSPLGDIGVLQPAEGIVDFVTYEKDVRDYYYTDDNMDAEILGTMVDKLNILHQYWQWTSFDFMSKNIGGLTTGNKLSCTQFGFDPNDTPFEASHDGNTSTPFFGCVFPDGYNDAEKINSYKNTIDDIVSTNPYFASNISKNTNMFLNNNANNGVASSNANKLGMFIKDDSSRKHLPADIALNASPSGTYGSPIVDLSSFCIFNPNYAFVNNLPDYMEYNLAKTDHVFRIPSKYQRDIDNLMNTDNENTIWLYKNSLFESAFDFKPTNIGKIQFRPLKMELYAWYETLDKNFTYRGRFEKGVFGTQLSKMIGFPDDAIDHYTRNIIKLKHINTYPVPTRLYNDKTVAEKFNGAAGVTSAWNFYQGLSYNEFLLLDLNIFNRSTPPSQNTRAARVSRITIPSEVAKFPEPYWRLPWQAGGSESYTGIGSRLAPAGAVGIIGAKCSTFAYNSIQFSTDNYMGMDSWFGNPLSPWHPSWGGWGGDNYYAFQTTQLYARIFQAWPKNQTLYDPRLFAVFHFNAGVGHMDPLSTVDYYKNGVLTSEKNTTNDYNNGNGTFYVIKGIFDVDLIFPTEGDGHQPEEKTYIYQNQSFIKEINARSEPYRKFEHWNAITTRRGKLLPYNWQLPTICAGGGQNYADDKIPKNRTFVDRSTFPGGLKPNTVNKEDIKIMIDYDIIIQSVGKCYTDKDIFTTRGGNGSGVFLNPILDEMPNTTSIIGFKYANKSYGRGFLPEDFLNLDEKFITSVKENTLGIPEVTDLDIPVEIIPYKLFGNGYGFKGGFVAGSVIMESGIDKKPEELGMLQLTPSAPISDDPSSVFIPELKATKNTSINIPSTKKSQNNSYDIFFRYHNDVSHTFSDSYGIGTAPSAREQHTTLTINPL